RIEPVQYRLQVHAVDGPDRIDHDGPVGTTQVGVAFAQDLLPLGRREPQRPGDGGAVARVAQLVGRDADVVGLEGARDGRTVAIAERAAAGVEQDALGAGGPRRLGPAPALYQLNLRRPRDQRHEARQGEPLNRLDADRRLGHAP